jgi:hypothetical protein
VVVNASGELKLDRQPIMPAAGAGGRCLEFGKILIVQIDDVLHTHSKLLSDRGSKSWFRGEVGGGLGAAHR